MNKIYSLRYSPTTGGFVAVPEFARKCVCRCAGKSLIKDAMLFSSMGFSRLIGDSVVNSSVDRKQSTKKLRSALAISLLMSTLFPAETKAGTVNNEIAYQLFRDFAENKGGFRPGRTDIAIYNKQGNTIGTLDKVAMPDFSSVGVRATPGVATLINPQYIVSVAHNGGYNNVRFGDGENQYSIVDRNNSPSLDFHAPRLNKLVTEVVPTAITAQGAVDSAYLDKERYPVFYRLGSGTQYIKDRNGQLTNVGGAYSWLTGGTVGSLHSYQNGEMISTSSGLVFDYAINGAMPIYGEGGDSGSPLFAWDTVQSKWVLVGVLTANSGPGGRGNNWAVIPLDFMEQIQAADNDAPVTFNTSSDKVLIWSFDQNTGTGVLEQDSTSYSMHGQQGNDLDAGKNLVFSGQNGKIDLHNSVYHGAGSLTFRDDYSIFSSTNSIWTGAGIIVDKDATVTWQVNGMKGDNLHKIGAGTLNVNGIGVNEGGLKVGDGIIFLNQQADSEGRVQAFDSLNIASGRATVVLADDRQVEPDNISWGYRGGTLDINGNNLTFHQLKAADYGAVLANNNPGTRATITLDYALSPENVVLNNWSGSFSGKAGDLYKYDNPYTKTTDYFILKKDNYGYFPTNQSSNDSWEYVGDNQTAAQKRVADRENATGYLYHGQLKGNLNVVNAVPEGASGALVLDGSADITGSFTQENGRLTLQGHPVIHAYNDQSLANKLAATGDTSVRTQPTSFDQDDWENRTFSFDRLVLKNTDFGLGRNATLNTDIEASNSVITLGDRRVFIDKNDGDGSTFQLTEGVSEARNEAERSVFNGSAILTGNSQLNVMNAVFNGDISGYSGTRVQLFQNGKWNMTKDSSLDAFRSRGGELSLLTDNWIPKKLTVNTMDASSLRIGMGVSTSDNTSDRIDIIQQARGGHNILDMSSLFDQTVMLTNDLTLASAPTGTSHGYFSFTSLNRGFSVYTPDTQVTEKDGRVLWQLKHNPIMNTSYSVFASTDDTEASASNLTRNSSGEQEAGNSATSILSADTSSPVKGETLFRGEDNVTLLNKARNMFASREYILSDNIGRWEKIIDYTDTRSGAWALTSYSHGSYDAYTVKQKGLDFGFRKHGESGGFWGTSVELSDGNNSTPGFRDDYRWWGASFFAGQTLASGVFVDGSVGYRQLSEDFSIQEELNDLSGKTRSHITTAGIRGGWRTSIKDTGINITPSVSVNGAGISGNQLKGDARSAELQAGNAFWLKAGLAVDKDFEGILVKTGVYRNITLNDMPGLTLSDTRKERHYAARKADRYITSVGIDGKLTEKLHIQLKLNSSFDGYFKTDYEGIMGIRYNF